MPKTSWHILKESLKHHQDITATSMKHNQSKNETSPSITKTSLTHQQRQNKTQTSPRQCRNISETRPRHNRDILGEFFPGACAVPDRLIHVIKTRSLSLLGNKLSTGGDGLGGAPYKLYILFWVCSVPGGKSLLTTPPPFLWGDLAYHLKKGHSFKG